MLIILIEIKMILKLEKRKTEGGNDNMIKEVSKIEISKFKWRNIWKGEFTKVTWQEMKEK